jgi:DNA-binding response OmpR family regulator
MPTKGFFTHDHPHSTAEIDSEAVIGLAISPFEKDLTFFQHMFDDAGRKLLIAHTRTQAMMELRRERIAVVLCERDLIDGNWKDILSLLASILNPPRLIVVSRRADDELWIEVLNMGGFDVLPAPLKEAEVVYAVGTAVLDWMEAEQRRFKWRVKNSAGE